MDKFSSPASKIIPFRIVVIYAAFGLFWFLLTDLMTGMKLEDGFHVVPHIVFILITACLLYLLVRRAMLLILNSHKREYLLFNHMNEAVFLHEGPGPDGLPGRFIEVNEAACTRLGYTRAEFLKMRPTDIDDPQTFVDVAAVMNTLQSTRNVLWEGAHLAKDGRRIPVEISNRIVDFDGHEMILSIARDITERKRVEAALLLHEEELKATNRRLEDIIEFLPDATFIIDPDKKIIAWNRAMEEMTGVAKKDILGQSHREASVPFYGEKVPYLLDFLDGPEGEIPSRYLMLERKGRCLSAEAFAPALYGGRGAYIWNVGAPLYDHEGHVIGMIESIRDITEHRVAEQALEKEHNLLRTLVDNIPDSVYVKDKEGRKILTNRTDMDFIGVQNESDILGKTDAEVFPSHLAKEYAKDDQNVLRHARPVINREEIIEDSTGVKRWLLTSKIPLKGQDGAVSGLVGIGRDITDRKLLESKLLTMAHYDSLTALPNRTLFMDKANMGLAHAKRANLQCAILFIDLDHFKSVNDTLGHSIGDALLKDTAAKLAECVRETDVMARLGGDEFIVLLNDLDDAEGARYIAERIREKLNAPRSVVGNDLFITASVGIVTYPHDGETLEDLLKNADTAMYAAKESGRNMYCFYDHAMNQKAVTRMQIERGLREALVKNELCLFYQPIVSVKDGKVRGFEALLRWFRAEGGLIFPNEFIPVAEDTGLIIPIGEWVLYEACRFHRMLMDAGFKDMVMSVNISVAQLRRKNIVQIIEGALKASGLPPEGLEIEVTESMLIDSFDSAIEVLNNIRALGVQVSLDDFGTGYSSLVHLQRLPIGNLKIDRFFIKEIAKDTDENAMIPAIIDLAHKLNLSVVAEGVETQIQLEKLIGNNCDYFQGYFLSRPMPAANVLPFLKGERPVDGGS
jgi:diguanylate cyclase (GGDEF)-like protein/PAS domain S-box-containing protein